MNRNSGRFCLWVTSFSLLWAAGATAQEPTTPVSPADPESSETPQFVPPDDGRDWLQLSSGEWLKGELISVVYDRVEFDSEILDKLEIDTEDIRGFYSSRRFGLNLRGEAAITGQLRIEGDRVSVISGSGERILAREDLIAVTVAAERNRDHWSGDLGLGINLRQGNTDRIEYNMLAGAVRRTPASRVVLDYIGSYDKTDDVETANDHRLNLTYDRFSGSGLFWRPLIGQYLRDPFQNIEHQVTLESGLGYEFIDNNKTEWNIYTGVGFNYVHRVSVEEGLQNSSTSPAFSLGTHYTTELTSWMDFQLDFLMTFLDEESGEYQHHLVTQLSTDLIGSLDLDISFIWDRTQSPPPLSNGTIAEQDDFRFITGIGFEF